MAISQTDLSRSLIMERFSSDNIFKVVPRDQGGFRPQEEMRTMTELLGHIGAFDDFLVMGIKHGNWAADIFTDRPEETVEECLAYTAYNRERLLKLIGELGDEGLARPMGPNPVFSPQMSVSNAIHTTLGHECHHRGQVAVYLRLMGMAPPNLDSST